MQSKANRLTIGFDAKRAFSNRSGLGNYSRTLLRQLHRYHPELGLHLFTPRAESGVDFMPEGSYALHVPVSRRLLWRSLGLARAVGRQNLNIYHGLSHELPFGIGRSGAIPVVTMHDVIFRRFPDQYPLVDRLIYDRKWRYSCEQAAQVIAISESTRNDLVEFYGISPQRVRVIYQSISVQYQEPASPASQVEVQQRHELPREYLLFVGSLTTRKNLLGLLKALMQLAPSQRPPLVVVGRGKAYRRQMMALLHRKGMAREVFFRPKMSDQDLPALYAGALALIYPSLYEGFGLPIVEALSQGTPVITSQHSAMPEALGPGGWLIDPHAPEQLAAALGELLDHPDLAQEKGQAGQAYVGRFSPATIAQQWANLYRELAGTADLAL